MDDKLQTFTQSNLLITNDKNLNACYLHVTQVNQLQLQAWLLLSDTHYIDKFTEIYPGNLPGISSESLARSIVPSSSSSIDPLAFSFTK